MFLPLPFQTSFQVNKASTRWLSKVYYIKARTHARAEIMAAMRKSLISAHPFSAWIVSWSWDIDQWFIIKRIRVWGRFLHAMASELTGVGSLHIQIYICIYIHALRCPTLSSWPNITRNAIMPWLRPGYQFAAYRYLLHHLRRVWICVYRLWFE